MQTVCLYKGEKELLASPDVNLYVGIAQAFSTAFDSSSLHHTLTHMRKRLTQGGFKVVAVKGKETCDLLHPKWNGYFKKNNKGHLEAYKEV